MKKMFIVLAAILMQTVAYAQTWNLDKAHANLKFTVTHLMISDVDGRFKDFDATITSSKPDFSDAKFEMTANVASIDTDNEKRDKHLRSPDFFDAEKYPTLSFTSTSLTPAGTNKFKLKGNLTMHGVTKPVTLDLVLRGTKVHPFTKGDMAAFQLSGTISRKEFNISGSPEAVVGDEVVIKANGEFAKAK
ncbi:polyisoprenoid-binding protein [Mucilaginibacter hurinus]|uniref:Polyisoprenoid-binding protein n=1 Tax=Mucilaginibacter hurinus TaxID=2201324 RepID=A0A367GKZ3_9SPHI|nr:YceI family protein [Mucilaginibacter hurinus]RCH54129.1 polyisoprenoid-binding protein [Mucilaginibacter hurinus]